MTTAELQEQGAIYFDKITDGFRNYKDIKLVMMKNVRWRILKI